MYRRTLIDFASILSQATNEWKLQQLNLGVKARLSQTDNRPNGEGGNARRVCERILLSGEKQLVELHDVFETKPRKKKKAY